MVICILIIEILFDFKCRASGLSIFGAMVIQHFHGDLEIVETGGVNPSDLFVVDSSSQHKSVELLSCGVLGDLEKFA